MNVNKKHQKEKRRALRKNQTKAEELMWLKLRNRQFMNLKFRRQYGIGEYIADFYCSKLKLVLEIDGKKHFTDDCIEYDEIRTQFLKNMGIGVIRVTNKEILENIEKALEEIRNILKEKIKKGGRREKYYIYWNDFFSRINF